MNAGCALVSDLCVCSEIGRGVWHTCICKSHDNARVGDCYWFTLATNQALNNSLCGAGESNNLPKFSSRCVQKVLNIH